jgi:glycosyltransferase involved in cell wall biosynthesis
VACPHALFEHNSTDMKFSIITPSFRNSKWLQLCIPSVADQEGVDVEHIVQDSCSDDGTQDWLPGDKRVHAYIEKDSGMYDAVNRGIKRAQGELMAYINCDEQYLPGALRAVHDHFEQHPELDIVIADFVVVDGDGKYICHRYATKPGSMIANYRISLSTCSLFYRKRVFFEHDLWFDTNWKVMADRFWIIQACKKKMKWGVLRRLTSIYTDNGENLSLRPEAIHEKNAHEAALPLSLRLSKQLLIASYRAKLLASGMYRQPPFGYSIYTQQNAAGRVNFQVDKPTGFWSGRRW